VEPAEQNRVWVVARLIDYLVQLTMLAVSIDGF
jgi:hypothetical protein